MRRIVHARQVLKIQMRINLRRADVGVAQQLLHGAQIARRFEHMARARMAQQVRIYAFPHTLIFGASLQPQPYAARRQRLAQPTVYKRIVETGLILIAQRVERIKRPSADGHDARFAAFAGDTDQTFMQIQIAPSHRRQLGYT